ncbi:hypothetical protein PWT90_02819 [Aphanocladium album]|nr:hypothetical protein PWT90_02819 [Aphanocladium album]
MRDLEANLPPTYQRDTTHIKYAPHPAPTPAPERLVRVELAPSAQADASSDDIAKCCVGFWFAIFIIGFVISISFNIYYAASTRC